MSTSLAGPRYFVGRASLSHSKSSVPQQNLQRFLRLVLPRDDYRIRECGHMWRCDCGQNSPVILSTRDNQRDWGGLRREDRLGRTKNAITPTASRMGKKTRGRRTNTKANRRTPISVNGETFAQAASLSRDGRATHNAAIKSPTRTNAAHQRFANSSTKPMETPAIRQPTAIAPTKVRLTEICCSVISSSSNLLADLTDVALSLGISL